jgi:hypothetical protein
MPICLYPGCNNPTTRTPQVCTKHFIEGFGRNRPIPKLDEPSYRPRPTTLNKHNASIGNPEPKSGKNDGKGEHRIK